MLSRVRRSDVLLMLIILMGVLSNLCLAYIEIRK